MRVVLLIAKRGIRRYDCFGVGPLEWCGWRLRAWKRSSYGNWDRQLVVLVGRWSVKERLINGSERCNGFRDVVVHVRPVGGRTAGCPATVWYLNAPQWRTWVACVQRSAG
eukprot:5865815-Pleurochrysis_carterae.AAC.1